MKSTIKEFSKALVPAQFRPVVKQLYSITRRLYYFGTRYICPFCNSYLRGFLPWGFRFAVLTEKTVVGGGYRLNSLCPVCGSLDRERLLYLYLLHETDIFEKTARLLHVAPEPRLMNILFHKNNIDYITADLTSNEVMVRMDITNMPYPDNYLGAIICNHVLEHIIDDRCAMRELYRTLKPDAWAILQVPLSLSLHETYEDFSKISASDREEYFGQWDHVRIYAKDYKDRLEEVGFKVNIFRWVTKKDKFGGRKNRFGLNEEEDVYVVSKPSGANETLLTLTTLPK